MSNVMGIVVGVATIVFSHMMSTGRLCCVGTQAADTRWTQSRAILDISDDTTGGVAAVDAASVIRQC